MRERPQGTAVDSARANLAATFVNAFVNAGFGTDKLMTTEAGGSADGAGGSAGESVTWIYKAWFPLLCSFPPFVLVAVLALFPHSCHRHAAASAACLFFCTVLETRA